MNIKFIDHIFHKKTQSSTFFVDILRGFSDVEIIYVDPDNVNNSFYKYIKKEGNSNYYVFWQIIPCIELLEKLSPSKVLLIPMYDACCTWTYYQWWVYRNYKFISFAKKIHIALTNIGIDSLYLQYVPTIDIKKMNIYRNSIPTAFFWNRNSSANLHLLFSRLKINGIKRIVCHGVQKNKRVYINDIDIIYTKGWFKNMDEYIKTVSQCHYYIAPRLYEGIGMSFLEAMGLGLCVIAPNQATMNEYITNGYNGYLFDSFNSMKFDVKDFEEISFNTINTYNRLSENWMCNKLRIKTFIEKENSNICKKKWFKFFIESIKIIYNIRIINGIKRRFLKNIY